MALVTLALGSNLGDRAENLRRARTALAAGRATGVDWAAAGPARGDTTKTAAARMGTNRLSKECFIIPLCSSVSGSGECETAVQIAEARGGSQPG